MLQAYSIFMSNVLHTACVQIYLLFSQTLIYIFGDMLNSVGAADKVFEYLDREPQVSTKGTLEPHQLLGHVQFQNLTFSYPSCPDHKILQVRFSWGCLFWRSVVGGFW